MDTISRRAFLVRGTTAAALALGPTPLAFFGEPGPAAGTTPPEDAFLYPPDAARPGVWWRWIDGNVTREGITRDLEAMAEKGLRAVEVFDVTGAAEVGDVAMMSPAWRAMFVHAVREARRLGIEVRIVAAAGWGLGGPWIDAAHAAKRLVYAVGQAEGPGRPAAPLPAPPATDGYYRDVAVVAFQERTRWPLAPLAVTASSAVEGYCNERNWPPEHAADADPHTYWRAGRAPTPDEPAWIAYRYAAPATFHAVYVEGADGGGPAACELQASGDGAAFHPVASFDLGPGERRTVAFAETAGRAFRLLIRSAHTPDVRLAAFQLLRTGDEPARRPGIKWWLFKSANRSFWDWPAERAKVLDDEYPDDGAFDCTHGGVAELSDRLRADGTLDWEVPPGRWTILRFGVTLLGDHARAISRATPGGYEADVLSPAAADRLYDSTAGSLLRDVGPEGRGVLTGVLVDSYEIGAGVKGLQPTWTEGLREAFARGRGYDLAAFLPALAGRIVDGREATNRLLWDYRLTLGEHYLRFYERMTERAHRDGLHTTAQCGYGTYPFPHIDGLAAYGRVDVPHSEFWFRDPIMSQHEPLADPVRTAASAAHTYGRTLVRAESATIADGYRHAPCDYKPVLDHAFCKGMNDALLHLWSLQHDVAARPGLFTYDLINANLTWYGHSEAFLTYLARCQAMLRRGLPVADAAYLVEEGTARFVPGRAFLDPALPPGYDFDGVNAEVLLTRLTVKDGRLVLPEGVSYRSLVLPGRAGWQVSLPVLRRLRALVAAGATVVGARPSGAPGRRAGPDEAAEGAALAAQLWGDDGAPRGRRRVGLGQVAWGDSLQEILAAEGVAPDLAFTPEQPGDAGMLSWIHRRDGTADLYFVSNQAPRRVAGELACRATGPPALWDPVTGAARSLPVFHEAAGRTHLPVVFEPFQSFFIVFDGAVQQPPPGAAANFPAARPVAEVTGPWEVRFDPEWGGPAQVAFERLEDWTARPEPGIRYYSGVARYANRFTLPPRKPAERLFLELGDVRSSARVWLNGHDLGVVWTAPWRVEITAVAAGRNELEVEVANLWLNRLVGDARLPEGQRRTRTNRRIDPDEPLLPAGLLGPVHVTAEG